MKDEDTTIHMNNHFQTFGQVGDGQIPTHMIVWGEPDKVGGG